MKNTMKKIYFVTYLLMVVGLLFVMTNITHADAVNITNQTYTIVETGETGTNTSFTAYDYLNIELAVVPSNTSVNQSQVWYSWFLNGVDFIKGWGINVVTFFFEKSDVGINVVSVNASYSNTTNSTGNTITWNINVTEPTLEPSQLQPTEATEVYDSITIGCRHEYTGHIWTYDIDVMTNQQNTSREWKNINNDVPTMAEWNSYDLTPYADFDSNLSIRCRTYNEYFGYSNYTYQTGIIKRSLNQIKLFRPIMNEIFIGQLSAFTTDCDMSKSNKYSILYHFVDANGDGTYDKLMEYSNTSLTNRSIFMFNTKFIISGLQNVVVGCIVQKKTTEAWDFSYCTEDKNTCTIQKRYEIGVLE